MPCTEKMIENALEKSDRVNLNSFTATPASGSPGGAVTLNWAVAEADDVTLKLNGVTISATGTTTVNVVTDTIFRIIAECGCNVSKTVGSVFVNVNKSSCRQRTIPESTVRELIIDAIDLQIEAHKSKLSKRTQTAVEVDATGISIKMRLKIAIKGLPNPDLDVDMKIGTGVGPGGDISVFYKSFSTDVDWPWWFTGVTAGISKIVEEIIEKIVGAKLKPAILISMRTKIAEIAQTIPGVLTQITPVTDAINLTICSL